MRWLKFTAIALLVLAFASISAIKLIRSQKQNQGNQIKAAQIEHIRQFWDTYKQASQARRNGEFTLAAELYQKALQLKPDHEDSLYYMGNCYFELGRFAEALDAYQRLVSVNPQGSSRGYMRIGLVYACSVCFASYLATPRNSPTTSSPLDNPLTPFIKGEKGGRGVVGFEPKAPFDRKTKSSVNEVNIEKAEQAFRHALQVDPDSGALLNIGEIALLKGKWQDAWESIYDFNTDNAMNPAPPYLLGYISWRQGKQKEAWEWFRLAVKRHEVKKPPTPWSEEGDVKASPELRWKAMAKQSLFGEHWLRLRRYLPSWEGPGVGRLKSSNFTQSIMEQEYRDLHKFVGSF